MFEWRGLKQSAVQRVVRIVAGEIARATPMPQIAVRSFEIDYHFGVRRQSEAATALWISGRRMNFKIMNPKRCRATTIRARLPRLGPPVLATALQNYWPAVTDVSILLGVSTKLSRHNSNVSKVHSSLR